MNTSMYNNMSISFLAKSFEEAEGQHQTVFAVLANERTIRQVRTFLRALKRSEDGLLFNKPMLLDPTLIDGQLFLATHEHRIASTPEDYANPRRQGAEVFLG